MGRRKPSIVERNKQQNVAAKRRLEEFQQEQQASNGLLRSIQPLDQEQHQQQLKQPNAHEDPPIKRPRRDPFKLSFRDAWNHQQANGKQDQRTPNKWTTALLFTCKRCYHQARWRSCRGAQRLGMVLDPDQRDPVLLLVDATNEPMGELQMTWQELFQASAGVHGSPELTQDIVQLVRHELLVMFWDPVQPHATDMDATDAEVAQWVLTIALDWHQYRLLWDETSLASIPRHLTLPKSMQHVMLWILNSTCAWQRINGLEQPESESVVAMGSNNFCTWKYDYPHELAAWFEARANPWSGSSDTTEEFDFAKLYSYLENQRKNRTRLHHDRAHNENSQQQQHHQKNLLVSLRKYQQEAVDWMISREQSDPSIRQPIHQTKSSRACSTLVELVTRPNGHVVVYYDLLTTRFYDGQRHDQIPSVFQPLAIQGGILADEMGLGKTVETISLVVTHPASDEFMQPLVQHPRNSMSEAVSQQEAVLQRDSLQCICGCEEDHADGWVQCDYCASWHHQVCVGWHAQVQGKFRCYQCYYNDASSSHGSVPCKATLIVSPESIHAQWEQEFRRHVRPRCLRVVRYQGVNAIRQPLDKHRKPSSEWQVLANPCNWQNIDVVLTTYETLTRDLGFVADQLMLERRRSTRQQKKRYAFVLSPLVVLRFWRVCMDEAQVGVENAQLRASLMANNLSCANRWIVTGTPFSPQWKDLYGSLKFLQIEPFHDEKCFDQLMVVPRHSRSNAGYQRLFDVFASCGEQLMWRTQKKHVLDQLQLPVQSQETVWCRFSEVEQHFYRQQEQKVVQMLATARQKYGDDTRSLHQMENDQEVDHLWHHLLVLRQICCHPQVGNQLQRASDMHFHSGRSGIGRKKRFKRHGSDGNKLAPLEDEKPMYLTMEDFLNELIAKKKLDCEEAQRKIIAAQNALCGLLILHHELEPAIIKYLATMELIRRNWSHFRADLLPRLHLLENLARIVREYYQLPSPTASTGDAEGDVEMVGPQAQRGDGQVVVNVDDQPQNPKKMCMLPALSTIKKHIGAPLVEEMLPGIQQDCLALELNGQMIKKFYLSQIELSHATAVNLFDTQWKANDRLISNSPHRKIKSTQLLLTRGSGEWWLRALEVIEQSSSDAENLFIDKLHAKLMTFGSKWALDFCQRFRAISGLRLCFVNELEALAGKRFKIYQKLMDLSHGTPTKQAIWTSGNCRKCRDGRDGPVCQHCLLYQQMENLRMHLLGMDAHFGMNIKATSGRAAGMSDIQDADDEVWQASATISNNTVASGSLVLEVFKEIGHFTKTLLKKQRIDRLSVVELETGLHHESELFCALVKEWNTAKKLLQVQHQRLGALDELEMALMQIRVREQNEVIDPTQASYIIESVDIDAKMETFQLEIAVAEQELREKHAQLRYLFNLKSSSHKRTSEVVNETKVPLARSDGMNNDIEEKPSVQTTKGPAEENNENEDDGCCLICLEPIQGERSVLGSCAHSFCKECMDKLTHQGTDSSGPLKTSIRCPNCRRVCAVENIRLVHQTLPPKSLADEESKAAPKPVDDNNHEDHTIELKAAGHGSKIDAVARRFLKLARDRPSVKAILFTQWQDMLGLLAWALSRNGITCFCYTTKRKLSQAIQDFKLCAQPCVLLLPFKIGANGLNLVEATEVFLIEPLLSTNLESQAINRVHRIGQTQTTRVHRFIVSGTVEARIREKHKHRSPPYKNPTPESTVQSHVDNAVEDPPDGEQEDDEELESELSLVNKNDREDLTLKDLSDLLGVTSSSRQEQTSENTMDEPSVSG